ncbi:tRNA (adenosine(37)-N6)-threonylcarbamoyltransferase complex ATPase subunit type 1 TsaE [Litoreibacter sp.]|nr:tRNA (adenosine(37)-N6)-threonylcarbamoyltransferase complex ATPase subunit type 1 TsaE [Litoreibacter sp.]
MTVLVHLSNQDETHRLAVLLASHAAPGLTVLLDGPVGTGKTTLARHIIQHCLAEHGLAEDVPSPTFTIIQTYLANGLEIWHADLYRLTSTNELAELGLDAAFEDAFCLVEWPDRLGTSVPQGLRIDLAYDKSPDARVATLAATSDRFAQLPLEISKAFHT